MAFSRVRSLFGSIAVKQSFVLVAMGGATAAAVGVGLLVFGALSASIDRLTGVVLPEIETSLDVISKANETRDAVSALLTAPDPETLAARTSDFQLASQALNEGIAALPTENSEDIAPVMAALEDAVANMAAARAAEFSSDRLLSEQIDELRAVSDAAQGFLTELKDNAYFDLTIGGEETLELVRGTLSGLTEREFAILQGVLELRGEVNLAIGLSLYLLESQDPAFSAILRDVTTAGLARLDRQLAELSTVSSLSDGLAPVVEANEYLASIALNEFRKSPGVKEELLKLRQSSDTSLSSLVDDLSFSLVILAEDTAANNEEAIRGLLENQVGQIIAASQVDSAVANLFVTALLGTAAQELSAVAGAQTALDDAWIRLERSVQDANIEGELLSLVGKMGELAARETGVIASRERFLEAIDASSQRSEQAQQDLRQIASLAQEQGIWALGVVKDAGASILEETTAAGIQMRMIAVGSVVLFALSLAMTWVLILRPMAKVTSVTERLATGDLAPVTGFDKTQGEIGRMARALGVFRDGLLQRRELEVQEKQREKAAREEEKQAEQRRREAERQETKELARRQQEARDKEAREAAEKLEKERAAQAERNARAEEQELVVSSLANALGKLSNGDLTIAIKSEFPEAYEGLRLNFNTAVTTLSELIRNLLDSASAVESSSADIASAANELATRTERNAAALEETAAAVTQLDASAQSASQSAQEAHSNMADVRAQVETGNVKMKSAVETMSDIENSSNEIAKIVSIIENIAFQTNLLALNAGVEAARAGEKGQGFAVVATEVRNLAQRSSEAAGEINQLITSTRSQIASGVDEVGDAGEGMVTILNSVQDISKHIQRIAQSSQEQASTVSEIGTAVSGLDQATQQNAAMFEESLAASELLRTEAGTLLAMASEFKTEKQAKSDPGGAVTDYGGDDKLTKLSA